MWSASARQRWQPTFFQSRMAIGYVAAIWASLIVVLSGAVLAKVRFDIPWHHTMGDLPTTAGWPFYAGYVSNVGAAMWAAIATVFLFRFGLHRSAGGDARWTAFFLWSGIFAAALGFDDLFLLHEEAFPKYLSVSQGWVVAAYVVLACWYLVRFMPQILHTAFPIFAMALGLLGASVALDQMQDQLGIYLPASGFLEDAAKLLGIGTWLSYAIHTCLTVPLPAPRAGCERCSSSTVGR